MTLKCYEYNEKMINEAKEEIEEVSESIFYILEELTEFFDEDNFPKYMEMLRQCGGLSDLSDYEDILHGMKDTKQQLRSIMNGWLWW